MDVGKILDLADEALDLAQMVPAFAPIAKAADIALDVALEGIALLSPADAKAVERRYAQIEARVTEHHGRTIGALKAAEQA